MSRSKRKTPICGHSKKKSEKKYKQLVNRRLRKSVSNSDLLLVEIFPVSFELSNPYTMTKDGKQWIGIGSSCDLDEYKRCMRK